MERAASISASPSLAIEDQFETCTRDTPALSASDRWHEGSREVFSWIRTFTFTEPHKSSTRFSQIYSINFEENAFLASRSISSSVIAPEMWVRRAADVAGLRQSFGHACGSPKEFRPQVAQDAPVAWAEGPPQRQLVAPPSQPNERWDGHDKGRTGFFFVPACPSVAISDGRHRSDEPSTIPQA